MSFLEKHYSAMDTNENYGFNVSRKHHLINQSQYNQANTAQKAEVGGKKQWWIYFPTRKGKNWP